MIDLLNSEPDIGKGDILVVGCVRNERLRLPWFLAHHRNLGVNKFLLIDNASDDGTREYLLDQSDVSVFSTNERYSESNCGVNWLNTVLNAYAIGHWTLVLDADELFIFPGFEATGLARFVDYLANEEIDAVIAPMLDMYPRGPIADTAYQEGTSLIEACPFFDGKGYTLRKVAKGGLKSLQRGGPRHRLFWQEHDRPYPSPVLTKIPLIRWKKDLALEASTHVLKNAKLAGVTGLLLHFKFLQDFVENASKEAGRQEHFAGARQYRAYADVLSDNPKLSAFWEGSVRYQNSAQLLGMGLMTVPRVYPFT